MSWCASAENPGTNLGLKKMIVELISVSEMACPSLLILGKGGVLEMETQKRSWRQFRLFSKTHLPKETGLSLWEAGQTRDEIVNGYPPVATDQQGQQG